MIYKMNDKNIEYMGRIDKSNPLSPVFVYAGSQLKIRFTGSEVSIKIKPHTVWGNTSLGYVIDGRMGKIPFMQLENDKETELKIVSNLEDKIHELIIYKRLSANYYYEISEINITGGEMTAIKKNYDMKLEFYGDSVTAGEVTEAFDFVGRCDPENHGSSYDNSYYSYAFITARNLNAEINAVAQGGIGVFDGTGYFHAPDYIGMESVYDKLGYFPEYKISDWDFDEYTPDIVVLALGQNDKHNGKTDSDDIDINDEKTRQHWKDGYKKIVRSLYEHYGEKTKFIFTTTVLMHDKAWDDAIEEIVCELNAENIKSYHNMFTRNGAATPGHPRKAEQEEMAAQLTAFIRRTL